MADELQKSLETLNRCLGGSTSRDFSDANDSVLNIANYFEDELSRTDLDSAFLAVFSEKSGILNFFHKTSQLKKFSKANTEIFEFLKYLVVQFHERISPHVLAIKSACVSCVSQFNTSVAEKEKAFDVLILILEKGPWGQDLNIIALINELFQQASYHKPSPKVLQKIYHILGVIAHHYPECMAPHSEKLFRLLSTELDKQTRFSSTVSYPIIAGCLNGLAEYLCTFSPSPETNPGVYKKIYGYVKKLSSPDADRRVAQRAALKLMASHGSLLATYIYGDYSWWHAQLLKWQDMSGEDKKAGNNALNMFYQEMASMVQSNTDDESKTVLMFFINFFRKKMLDKNATIYEMGEVIKGFGMFSGPCMAHLSNEDVQFMFTLLIQRAQQVYLNFSLEQDFEKKQKGLQNFPNYVESIANIIIQLRNVSPDHLSTLRYMTVFLFQNFAHVPVKFHSSPIKAFTMLFYSLAVCKGVLFEDFIKIIVYQGVVRTCSHSVAIDVELQKDQSSGKSNFITYKNFVPLWLSFFNMQSYENKDITLAAKKDIVRKLYDEFLRTVLVLLSKLDLSTIKKTDWKSDMDYDRSTGLQANTPQDFQVFINIVDLCIDVIPNADVDLFEKWIQPFTYHIIMEASHKPHVSGFYKLLTISLQLADKLRYFGTSVNDIDTLSGEVKVTCELVCQFLQDMLARLKQYKGDLQIACLKTLLVTPVPMVPRLICSVPEAFQAVFKVGRSFLQLAHLGMDALEKWTNALPSKEIQPLLKQILPCLDPFLQSKGSEFGTDGELEILERNRKSSSGRHQRHYLTRKRLVERPDTELVQLQRRILRFLGPLNSDTAVSLLGQTESIVLWGHNKKLKYNMPFQDIRPCIYLDHLLPRIVELALNSSDRQTKVAACELLHAIVMFMLGTSVQVGGHVEELSELSELFKELFLPLLQLGCDTDQVVYQLFHPLVLQLTHWYSSGYQLRSKNTAVLIDTLLDGITHPTDTAVRDISAECLHEFVVWAIKQQPASELDSSSINIRFIVKKIQVLCMHPSSSKRLGAALAFNSMYTVLREKESVIDEFWLELLYYLMQNLSQIETEGVTTGAVKEIELAVDHLERVLRERAALFNKESVKRRKPPHVKGKQLSDTVVWLLKQCGNLQTECRHKSMQLVCSLAPHLPDCSSTKSFVDKFISTEGIEELLQICEGSVKVQGIHTKPTLGESEPSTRLLQDVLQWLQLLLASLDCYVWLLGQGLISPEILRNKSTRIMEASIYFIQCVSDDKELIDGLLGDWSMLPPWDCNRYKQMKCTVAVRLFDFIVAALHQVHRSKILQYFPENFFDSHLWQFICTCLFCPTTLGFDLRSSEVVQGLPRTLEQILQAMKASLVSTNLLQEFYCVLNTHLKKHLDFLLGNLKKTVQSSLVSQEIRAALQGVVVLHKSSILTEINKDLPMISRKIVEEMFSTLVEQNLGVAVTLQPSAQMYGEAVLDFAFSLEQQVPILLQYVQNNTEVKNPYTQSVVQHGEHFLTTFHQSILTHLLHFPQTTVDGLLAGMTPRSSPQPLCVLEQLLQFSDENRKQRYQYAEKVVSAILQQWPALQVWGEANVDQMSQLLVFLAQVAACSKEPVGCFIELQNISKWLLSQLVVQDLPLHVKNRVLDLLPCLTNSRQESNTDLVAALQGLREQHFPQLSAELRSGSLQKDNFVLAFRKLLSGLQVSGSSVLLHSIVSMTVCDKKHVCEDNIQKTLPVFIRRLNSKDQLQAIDIVYGIFWNDKLYDPQARLGCVLRFVVPLLQVCSIDVLKELYVKHIRQMLDELAVKPDASRMLRTEHQLISRIGIWHLFELLFARLPSEHLEDKTCPITIAAFPAGVATGKELITDLTRKAFGTRSESLPVKWKENTTIIELFRQVQCAAYKMLAIMVSNTKKEQKFYTGFLFTENKDKNQLIWENLVDCNKTYSFPIDWDEIPSQRKLLVSIRKEASAGSTVQYLPTDTQLLFTSTLAEDVTRFDLSTVVVRESINPSENIQSVQDNAEVELEADSLNQHECMATLCGVLQHLVERGISPVPQPGEEVMSLPPWMECLRKGLEDRSKHRNVHLFLLKLILNNEIIFKPYAKIWLYPIMQVLVRGCLGNEINYMVIDVIKMLTSWISVAIPSASETEKLVASEVLNFLMTNAKHNRRDILKYNLEVIRTVVEVWKPCLNVPHQFLLDQLTVKSNDRSRNSDVGIQLVGIILANNMQPWSHMSKQNFLSALLSLLNNHERLIYLPCSEVIGMVLKHFDPQLNDELVEDDSVFFNAVKRQLQLHQTKHVDTFLLCLHGIHKHYPPVVDSFLAAVLFQLPKVSGKLKIMCLNMILARLELLGKSAYAELSGKGLEGYLTNRNEETQLLALHIVDKMLHDLEPEPLEKLLKVVIQLATLRSSSCRGVVYNIMMWAYDQKVLTDDGKGMLLAGLVDSDPVLQNTVFKFWNDDVRLPASTPQRLLTLLGSMFSTHTEQHFLGYASRLLLDPMVRSPDFNIKLFEHPLSQCSFEDLQVLVSWRARHASIAPMFADTLSSQLSRAESLGGSSVPQLRATQASLAFQPTIDIGADDSSSGSKFPMLTSSTLNSSLLFTIGSGSKNYKMGPNFGSSRMKQPEESSTGQNSSGSMLLKRRRFLRNQKKISSMYASFEAKKATRRQELQQERITRREANVAMYRNYRIGDFPDIEIPHSAIVQPLQALAQRDVVIGRQVLVSVFSGIMNELSGDETADFAKSMTTALGNILNETNRGTPMLMGAVLEMAHAQSHYISLDPESVVTVSRISGLLPLGCLVLEEELIEMSDVQLTAKRKYDLDQEQSCWLRLAELYQNMEEWDVVRGIFSQKLSCHVAVKAALEAEAEGYWHDAQLNYKDAIHSNDPDSLKDYYYEAFYKCLAHLSQWETLHQCIDQQLEGSYENLWTDVWNQAKLLPWLFVSELQLMGSRNCSKFLDAVQLWVKDKEKATYITTHLNEELAVLCVLEQDFVRAQSHVDHSHSLFLENWGHMSPMAFKQRALTLRNLHRLAELQIFLDCVNTHTDFSDGSQAEQICSRWHNNLPTAVGSLIDWDRRIAYRSQFGVQLREKLNQNVQWLEQIETEMQLAMIDASLEQNNFHVAKKYIIITEEKLSNNTHPKLKLHWVMGHSKCQWLRSKKITEDTEKLEWILKAWDNLVTSDPQEANSEWAVCPILQQAACQQASLYAQDVWQLLQNNSQVLKSVDQETLRKLTSWICAPTSSSTVVLEALKNYGLTPLQSAAHIAEKEFAKPHSAKEAGQAVANAYFQIAKYCQMMYSDQSHESHIVTSVLRAMKFGSKEAQQLFPCLLQLEHLATTWINLFNEECAGVPEWMFLGWVSQILACLDAPLGQALHNLTLRLAEEYPQAVTYPFRLSREKYKFSSSRVGRCSKDFIKRLESILIGDTLMETFLKAFACLAQPETILEYHLRNLYVILQEENFDQNVFQSTYATLCDEVFSESQTESDHIQGESFAVLKEYEAPLKKDVQQFLEGETEASTVKDTLKSTMEKLRVSLKSKDRSLLKKYSPWLSEFQGSHWSDKLEIPGQYTGESRPLPQYHIRISSFQQQVRVMPSLRRPIQVTILGNDAKEYRYLVKFGEDLRQDQRIEQLFCLMNKILAQDPACCHRKLEIVTYQVIPLTSRLGIIQWLDGTKTLKSILDKAVNEEEKRNCKNINMLHWIWLCSASDKSAKADWQIYGNAYLKYSRDQIIAAFRERVNMIPWDILKRALLQLSPSPEAFFSCRHNFACSYAVLCISHWLLGIGDRHLDNCMIMEANGSCMGIDFGYAFGISAHLAIPELVPFRMTPHILNLLLPLQETGLVRGTMVHCLRALRTYRHMLLATMEVFVQEPSLNWLEMASKEEKMGEIKSEEEWYPRQKLLLAQKKLEGANPVSITSEELKSGHNKNPHYLSKYLEVLQGHNQHNVRSRLPAERLTPNEQVECLLDLSTDYCVLGLTYAGWMPWM